MPDSRPSFASHPVDDQSLIRAQSRNYTSGVRYYGHRFYHPETGRWVSRDPIGEEGGRLLRGSLAADDDEELGAGSTSLCLYVALKNTPVNLIDGLGLRAVNFCCCDGDKIREGITALGTVYKSIETGMIGRGCRRKGLPLGVYPCNSVNSDVLLDILNAGLPPCWSCGLERRENRYWDRNWGPTKGDHTVVICQAYGKDGSLVKEMMFDFWEPKHSPGENPMNRFRRRWPFPDRKGVDFQSQITTCPQ